MNIQTFISDLIISAASNMDIQLLPIELEKPADPQFGDYSSNVAMIYFKSQNANKNLAQGGKTEAKNSRELAQHLVELMQDQLGNDQSRIERIEVAGPGFINFYLSKELLFSHLNRVIQSQADVIEKINQGQKVVVEFTDPNPFKEFHIGHLYSNTVGESISRLIEATGGVVWRADYFGDVGMHVAKSIWGILSKLKRENPQIVFDFGSLVDDQKADSQELLIKEFNQIGELTLEERIKFLGQAYALGATAYETDPDAKAQMQQMNFLIYKAGQDRLLEEEKWEKVVDYDKFIQPASMAYYDLIKMMYFKGRKWSIGYFDAIYQRLGMKFDGYYPESKAGELGYEIVNEHLNKGVFEKSQGAIIFKGSKFGFHDRVFINSLGLPTYEAKELSLPKLKQLDFAYQRSIIITGNEINEYFKVLMKALSLIDADLANKTIHLGHGMVRLPDGKMSSRTGKILTGLWLLEEAKEAVLKIMRSSQTKKSNNLEGDAEIIGQSAIKYAFLRHSVGSDIAFSFDQSLDFQGNSGPYLLYTYVRCKSVLEKELNGDSILPIDILFDNKSYLGFNLVNEEHVILQDLLIYSDIVVKAAIEYAPHYLSQYLYKLAQDYSAFYNSCSILSAKDERKTFRLALTRSVMLILEKGLAILGIKVVAKM